MNKEEKIKDAGIANESNNKTDDERIFRLDKFGDIKWEDASSYTANEALVIVLSKGMSELVESIDNLTKSMDSVKESLDYLVK